jgi:hypothetical protein
MCIYEGGIEMHMKIICLDMNRIELTLNKAKCYC